MNEAKEMTALKPFVGANEEQPGKLKTSHSISENDPEFNSLTEDSGDWEKKMLQKQLNPGYLESEPIPWQGKQHSVVVKTPPIGGLILKPLGRKELSSLKH